MSSKRTFEEISESGNLCDYCPLPEDQRGVRCYGGEPIMCEGTHCDEAYDAYTDSDDDEEWDGETL